MVYDLNYQIIIYILLPGFSKKCLRYDRTRFKHNASLTPIIAENRQVSGIIRS